MSECKGFCIWCAGFQFTLGLTALFLWLSLRPSKPTFSIDDFHVPALNQTSSQFTRNLTGNSDWNTTIEFDLKIKNTNKDKGIYYDAINVSLGYGDELRIAGYEFPGFYQGFQKTAHRQETVAAERKFWGAVFRAVTNDTVIFRVGLVTAFRYKILGVKTRRHRVNLVGEIAINEQGNNLKKSIKLGSNAPKQRNGHATVAVFLIFLVLFLDH